MNRLAQPAITAGRQTTQNETTLAANEGDAATPGQSGVTALDRAFSILFAFRPGDYALTLVELAVRAGFYKDTVLRLAGSLIQHRMLFRLEDGRYQVGIASLVLGALRQRSMRLGNTVLLHMYALVEAMGEAILFYIHERGVHACLHCVNSNHSIRDHVREGDVLPLEHGSGGCVLCAFSGMRGVTHGAIRYDHYYVLIGKHGREMVGLSVPMFGVQQALRGALCLAGPASRIDRALLQSWCVPALEYTARTTSALGDDPAPLRLAAQPISRT